MATPSSPITNMSLSKRPQRFIDDLVPLILESNNHWWTRDYVRLALVSPAWVGPIRRRLYARPTLDTFRACKLFVRSLTDNPALLELIHAIDLRPIANNEAGLFAEDMSSLRCILGMKTLRSIVLGGELAVGAERFLHSLASSRDITELYIDGHAGYWGCGRHRRTSKPSSLEWDHIVAFRFPSLKKLTLTNLELSVENPYMSYALKLEELVLDRVNIVAGFIPDLSHDSWSELRTLRVVAHDAADLHEHIRQMVEWCPVNLRSLHYEVRDCSRAEGLFDDVFEPCPSLQELHLTGVETTPDSLAAVGRLFQNLEVLLIHGRNVHVTVEEWTAFVESRALPSLRQLHLPSGNPGPPFMYWSEEMGGPLREACAARKLDLHCNFISEKPLQLFL